MVLVDTSIWFDHLRTASTHLCELLEAELVAVHPFVIGELACGNLSNRQEVLALLGALPTVPCAEHDEVLYFIEQHSLAGRGLGLIDVHLLASSQLSQHPLWTRDKRLLSAAEDLGLDFGQPPVAGE